VRGICDDGFNDASAAVACQQLYGNPKVQFWASAQNCKPWTTFWIDDLVCNGTERTLDQCKHNPWGQNNCKATRECVVLKCVAGPDVE
jgi:hypothetical protein